MINRVTITGADDSVNGDDLVALSKLYPFVEWGILFAGFSASGASRFPSANWLDKELPKLKNLNLCCHLCGRWVRDLVLRGDFTWIYAYPEIADMFGRFQINTHGLPHLQGRSYINRLLDELKVQFIFQLDGTNDNDVWSAVNKGAGVPFYDTSSGAGMLPKGWPSPPEGYKKYIGYSGGLGPLNIEEQLPLIHAAANGNPYWIDMESRVRSNKDELLDLEKVETVLKVVKEFMEKE